MQSLAQGSERVGNGGEEEAVVVHVDFQRQAIFLERSGQEIQLGLEGFAFTEAGGTNTRLQSSSIFIRGKEASDCRNQRCGVAASAGPQSSPRSPRIRTTTKTTWTATSHHGPASTLLITQDGGSHKREES